MSGRSVDDWLGDIVLWGKLESHLRDATWGSFFAKVMLQGAVSKCVEAIGEAAGKLDNLDHALSAQFFGIQLKLARRSRARLSHGDYHVDLAILWQTATESVLVTAARSAPDVLRRGP